MSIRMYSRTVATAIGLLAYKFQSTRKLYKASARLIQPVGELIFKNYRSGEITADLDARLARGEIRPFTSLSIPQVQQAHPFAGIGSGHFLEQPELPANIHHSVRNTEGTENKGESGGISHANGIPSLAELTREFKTTAQMLANERKHSSRLGYLSVTIGSLGIGSLIFTLTKSGFSSAFGLSLSGLHFVFFLVTSILWVKSTIKAKSLENHIVVLNKVRQIQKIGQTNPHEFLQKLGELSDALEKLGVLDPETKKEMEAASRAAQIQQMAKTDPIGYLQSLGELADIFSELGMEHDPEEIKQMEAASRVAQIQQMAETDPQAYMQRLGELSDALNELGVGLNPELEKIMEAVSKLRKIGSQGSDEFLDAIKGLDPESVKKRVL